MVLNKTSQVGGWVVVGRTGRSGVGEVVGAALTRTSLSIAAELRGRSAGLRRGSPLRCLTGPVTRELTPAGLVWGCCDDDDGGGGGGGWMGVG